MKVLIDVNLSPRWVGVFEQHSIESLHWTSVDDPRASDRTIMEWARQNGYIVFTHDLDFSTILALTGSTGPSVVQVRTQDVTPPNLESVVIAALREHEAILKVGAIIVIDESRSRARILPLRR